jgi:hypothetical protein
MLYSLIAYSFFAIVLVILFWITILAFRSINKGTFKVVNKFDGTVYVVLLVIGLTLYTISYILHPVASMSLTHVIVSDTFGIVGLVSFASSFTLMNIVKSKVPEGQQDQSPLTSHEKTWILVTCTFSPLFSQAVYYYGWKKKLPVKAKSANKWGWLGFILGIILYQILLFI